MGSWREPLDALVCWAYRVFYCSRRGHQEKFSLDYCLNCGKPLRRG